MGALTQAGLTEDEAFLVAVKRMGSLDAISRDFACEHSERLWKQLVIAPENDAAPALATRTGTPKAHASAVSKVACRHGLVVRDLAASAVLQKRHLVISEPNQRPSARGPARGTVIDKPDAP